MKDTEKKKGCCSCDADVKREVNELVENVEGYSKQDRDAKKKEVEAAFDKKDKK